MERKSQGDFQNAKQKNKQKTQQKQHPAILPNKISSKASYFFPPDITEMTINQSGYFDFVQHNSRGVSKNEVLNYSAFERWCNEDMAGKDKLQNKYFPLTATHTAASFLGEIQTLLFDAQN